MYIFKLKYFIFPFTFKFESLKWFYGEEWDDDDKIITEKNDGDHNFDEENEKNISRKWLEHF